MGGDVSLVDRPEFLVGYGWIYGWAYSVL